MGPATALGLALILNVRPKGLLLGAAAGLAIAGARLADTDAAIVIVIYLALASSTVTVPIIATLVFTGTDAASPRRHPGLVPTATVDTSPS